jgi:hypothetical protein
MLFPLSNPLLPPSERRLPLRQSPAEHSPKTNLRGALSDSGRAFFIAKIPFSI